jgi:hypothetical protein
MPPLCHTGPSILAPHVLWMRWSTVTRKRTRRGAKPRRDAEVAWQPVNFARPSWAKRQAWNLTRRSSWTTWSSTPRVSYIDFAVDYARRSGSGSRLTTATPVSLRCGSCSAVPEAAPLPCSNYALRLQACELLGSAVSFFMCGSNNEQVAFLSRTQK